MDDDDLEVAVENVLEKNDVLKRFCQLSRAVAEHFWSQDLVMPADCFCGQSVPTYERALLDAVGWGEFQFDARVLEFIEAAVRDRLPKTH